MVDGGKFQENLIIFYAIQSGDANGSETTQLNICLIKAISTKSLEDKTIGNHLTNYMQKYHFG